jgi:hypothetical protein
MDERQAMALLCESLPALRAGAEAQFWAEALEMHIEEVAAGGPALHAVDQLGLIEPPPTIREGVPVLHGLEPVRLVGDYRCPRRRCSRRAERDDQGRPPLCALIETPMVFETQR